MIVVRNPVLTRDNVTGYTDYAACVYPVGVEGDSLYYFNHEHIAEILFTGYIDELEERYQDLYLKNKGRYKYPKLKF
jgi:complete genome